MAKKKATSKKPTAKQKSVKQAEESTEVESKARFVINTGGSQRGKRPLLLATESEPEPIVVFSEEAHAVINAIQNSGRSDEVSWIMVTEMREDLVVYVHKIFIPEQECTGATTSFGPEDFGDMMMEWGTEYDGPQQGERLNAWFHLHPGKMGVGPSGQDETQMADWLEAYPNVDFWLRGIVNGQGERKLDLYFPQQRVQYADVLWRVDRSAHQHQIDRVMDQIAERAKKKVYTPPARHWQGGNQVGKNLPAPIGGSSGKTSPLTTDTKLVSTIYDFEAVGCLEDKVYIVNNRNGLEYEVVVNEDDGELVVIGRKDNKLVNFSHLGNTLIEDCFWEYWDAISMPDLDDTPLLPVGMS